MKKLLKKMVCAILMVVTMGALSSISAGAASCTDWYEYSRGAANCQEPRCGIFWYSPSNKMQRIYQKKVCIKNSKPVTEYKYYDTKIGCC